MFVQIKRNPWKIPLKVFIVIKAVGFRSLTLLKWTLSQICFKNSAKINALCFREWLINVQLRSALLIMPVINRNKFHFPLKKVDLNKQWIRFVNRRDWLATKPCMNYILKWKTFSEIKNVQYSGQWIPYPPFILKNFK